MPTMKDKKKEKKEEKKNESPFLENSSKALRELISKKSSRKLDIFRERLSKFFFSSRVSIERIFSQTRYSNIRILLENLDRVLIINIKLIRR